MERVTLHEAFAFRFEEDLQSDLRVDRLSGADAGGTVVGADRLSDGVGAEGKVLEEEFAAGGCRRGVRDCGVYVGCGDSGIGYKCALNICYGSVDSASEGLCHR